MIIIIHIEQRRNFHAYYIIYVLCATLKSRLCVTQWRSMKLSDLKITLYPHVLCLSYTRVTWLKTVLGGTTLLQNYQNYKSH